MDKKFSILYVDDDESNLHIFKNTFRREYNVCTALCAEAGLEILDNKQIDLIIADQRMPEMDGVDFLKIALNKYPDLNRILVTAYTDFNAIRNAINEARIFQYIQKPWTEDKLRRTIEQGLDIYRLKKENAALTTELKEKNEQLEKINNDLVEFEKLKSDFLSLISHEIRTPLNGLVGPFKLLKEELNSESKNTEKYIKMLENSVNKLEQFSVTALHITALKAEKYLLYIETCDVNKTIKDTINLLEDRIYKKNINITYDIKISEINADKELFKMSVKELVDNAIKYSSECGIINIKTYTEENWIILQVIDNGQGFEKKYLDNLFKLFITSDQIKSKNLGLDLALVKHIMDAHSGKIEIQNNTDQPGATVKLYFKNNG